MQINVPNKVETKTPLTEEAKPKFVNPVQQALNQQASNTFVEPKIYPRPTMPRPIDSIANWEIESRGDGLIYARNNYSFEIYEGTTADFNKKLRGE